MSSRSHFSDRNPTEPRNRTVFALLLIALGGVFFLTQTGALDADFNWWALFIVLPAAALLADGLGGTQPLIDRLPRLIGGLLLLALALGFMFDPEWTMFSNLKNALPVLRDLSPEQAVGWVMLLIGALLLVRAVRNQSTVTILPGAIFLVIGATLAFKVSGGYIVPVILLAAGVSVLLKRGRE
ncbi:MAG: hypothetical protein IPK19_18205 [Chloroflexi bacterium]|nr:hypothetical protein [Chloroflexota bacterium]